MKKKTFTILFIFLILFSFGFGEKKQQNVTAKVVVKTYFLKNISPRSVAIALKPYLLRESVLESKKMLTVTLYESNVSEFERLLKILDKKMRKIELRIFTVIAADNEAKDKIDNKDLKKVISELKKIINFKSYTLDGTSFIPLKEGARRLRMNLSSQILNNNRIDFDNIAISVNKKGKRTIDMELSTGFGLRTDVSLDENGYVVAGVSDIQVSTSQKNKLSIILILNARIID